MLIAVVQGDGPTLSRTYTPAPLNRTILRSMAQIGGECILPACLLAGWLAGLLACWFAGLLAACLLAG